MARLRSGNHPGKVGVLVAFQGAFLAFSFALGATLLFLLLFLSAGTFSLAFFHPSSLRV